MSKLKKSCRSLQANISAILLLGVVFSACSTANTAATQTTPPDSSGIAAAASDDLAADEAAWRTALAADPTDPQANYILGMILSISAPEDAAPYFERAAATSPELAPHIDRITDALQIGELSDNPAYRLTLLGQALGALHEWELAKSALLRATQQDPEYAEAWAYLGEAQQQTGEDGFQALNTALSLNPNSYSANLLMALYWRRSGSPTQALGLLLVAAEQDPNNLSLKEDIANVYAEIGEVETGLSILQAAADTSPDQSVVWQMLARLSLNYDIKLQEVGLPAARQAVLLDGQDPTGLVLLGRCYFQTSNTSMAERFFLEAARLAPNMAEAHYFLGLLYLNQGDQTAAQDQLTLAYQLAPNEVIGLQAFQVLEQFFGSPQ